MENFTIQMNYTASITVDVVANDEGEALDKARDIAEDADIREYTLGAELPSKILRRS